MAQLCCNLHYLIILNVHIYFDSAISILDILLIDTRMFIQYNNTKNKILKPRNYPDDIYQE